MYIGASRAAQRHHKRKIIMLKILITPILLAAMLSPLLAQAVEPPSPKHVLVRVPIEPAEVQALYDLGLDVWDVAPDGQRVDIRLSWDELDNLRAMGFAPTVLDADVYATIERNTSATASPAAPWTTYHSLAAARDLMQNLADAHPERAALMRIGTSYEGRPIHALRIAASVATAQPDRPAFFVVGCHHAREWISVEVSLYLAERLIVDYERDARIRRLLDAGEVWVVPILNVDGLAYSQTYDRLWRSNRRDFGQVHGVDLNRNYGYQWGRSIGSSGIVGAETYRGAAPFSEPETQAVRNLFASRRFIGSLAYHSYGQIVLTPWAYTYGAPPDGPEMRQLADEVAEAMNGEHTDPAYDYRSGQWASSLYVASGVFADWAYGVHGMMVSLIELRPRAVPFFLLPPDEILPTCIEAFAGSLHMIERVFGIHPGPPGDFDGNRVIEWADASTLVSCLWGPGEAIPGFPLGCFGADIAQDGRTDLRDFARFQNRFGSGPGDWPDDPDDLTHPE